MVLVLLMQAMERFRVLKFHAVGCPINFSELVDAPWALATQLKAPMITEFGHGIYE